MPFTFVDDISHKLRTPLTNIKLYIALLEKSNPSNQARYTETLKRETNRLQHITEDMLMLSQFDLGKIEPCFELVDLAELLRDVVEAHKGLALSREVVLHDCAVGETPHTKFASVHSDTLLLKEAMQQLLTNAIVYTKKGGEVIVEATLRADGKQKWCAIAVRDTGAGIDAAEAKHIFERSYRGRSSLEMGIAGTGFGLTICREIASYLNGLIELKSALGVGSTFTLLLPI